MKLAAFIYHDVLATPDHVSGFEGADADWYKLSCEVFEAQVDALLATAAAPPERLAEPRAAVPAADRTVLTFDDGGASALAPIADCLESRGLRGRFFVVTERLGTPGFLTAAQLCELDRRGHAVGSHSATHRTPFAALPPHEQREEWRRSLATLADVLGRAVTTASVPGGAYDRRVAGHAAEAGVELLFNSEPERVVRRVEGLHVAGRYMLTRATPAAELAALARGDAVPRARRWLDWNARKLAKSMAGPLYAGVRRRLLARRMAGAAERR